MNDLVAQFATAKEARLQRAALVSLIKTKLIHEAARHNLFKEGLRKLGKEIQAGRDIDGVLIAAATLERAAAVVKTLRPQTNELLQKSITTQLPDLHELDDGNDRQYAARTWRAVRSSWYIDYLAKAAVREESGENIRKECLEGVITLAEDVSAALGALQQAFMITRFETKHPGDSAGRRFKRVLGHFTTILMESHKSMGQDVGRRLSLLVRRTFRKTGIPENSDIKSEVTYQISRLIHGIVRTSFSFATQDSTYEALSIIQGWFDPSDWVRLCESSDTDGINLLQNDLRESILLLAKVGIVDDALRRTLGTTLGSSRRADEVCREIAITTPGLKQDVRDRLAGVLPRRKSVSAAENQEWAVDEILAELLIETDRLSTAANMVQTGLLPEVSTILPHSVRALSTLTGLANAFSNRMALVLKRRSLRTRGIAGDVIEFSPLEHQLSGNGTPSRRVRIVTPLVERISEDGVPQLVRKALVEPIAD